MSDTVQYVTNQQRERVAVLLDLETYHLLTNISASDEELLTALSLEELQALANSHLTQVDHLNILKTRARYTLKQLHEVST